MGKVRSKRSGGRLRPQPTGLPSVKEMEKEEEEEKLMVAEHATPPLIAKLSSTEAGEREWACRSLAHLVCEPQTQLTLLNHQGLPRLLMPLLLDREWAVREAAAGALRNMSAVGGESVCESLVRGDVVTALSALFKECLSQLQSLSPSESSQPADPSPSFPSPSFPSPSLSPSSLAPSSPTLAPTPNQRGKGKGRRGREGVVIHQVTAVAEQGLHLLLNISESSNTVVGVVNQEQVVLVLLHFLTPSLSTPHILTTAALCLYTLTEDNPPSHHLLTATPSHLAQLQALLSPQPLAVHQKQKQETESGHMLIVSSAIAGVFQHLPPTLLPAPLVSSVITVLAAVLDTDVSPLLHTLTSTPPHTPPQSEGATAAGKTSISLLGEPRHVMEEVENVLSAQQLALEVTANFCCTESEEGEGEWEDVEEEEMIGGDVEGEGAELPMEQDTHQQAELPTSLTAALVEVGMVERVWRKCCPLLTPSPPHSSPEHSSLHNSLRTVQSRAFAALQNLLSVLPRDTLHNQGGVAAVWRRVIELVASGGVAVCDDVTGLLVVLARAMEDEELQCVGIEHLQVLSTVCREQSEATQQQQLRADIIVVMATVGRRSLKLPPPLRMPLLQVVGEALRECVSHDVCVWVVARALDALYDVFGADECPTQLFSTLQIMPVLKHIASQFTARVRVERKALGSVHCAEVVSAQDNMQPFMQYMTTRTTPPPPL